MGFKMQGIIPKKLLLLIESASMMAEEIFSLNQIEEKIADPENFEKIMPMAEEHIDHFLRVKLIETMPMISMFIGDKTITQLKVIFMDELRDLFPSAMKSYVIKMQENINMQHLMREKIERLVTEKIEPALKKNLSAYINRIALFAAAFGFIIGLLELLLLH